MAPERAPCFYDQNPQLECPLAEGKFPVPNSCTKYFFCFDWEIAGFFECTGGWHFLPQAQTCGPAEHSSCRDDQSPSLECRGVDGMFPVPNSCTEYFFCFNSEIIGFFECADGWHFFPGAVEGEGECGVANGPCVYG